MTTWKRLARILTSTIFGGLLYSIWLAVFLLSSPNGGWFEATLRLVAPIITALGFAIGIIIFDHFGTKLGTPFLELFIWPLLGCTIGAVIVYWFGPMLIVFSMLVMGTLSIAIREARLREN